MNEPPSGAKVALYLRCSTGKQENSVGDQSEMMKVVVKDLGVEVAGTYKTKVSRVAPLRNAKAWRGC